MEEHDEHAQPTTARLTDDQARGRAAQLLLAGQTESQTALALTEEGVPGLDARHIAQEVRRDLAAQLESERVTSSVLPRAVIAGAVAAVSGGIAWAMLTWKSGYEVGFAAWGIGLLAGFLVLKATGERRGTALQAIAVGSSLVGILLGKYLAVWLVLRDQLGGSLSAFDPLVFDFIREYATDVFSPFDLLFVGFAVFTAWRMLQPTRHQLADS